jgi:hypothetical protein
VNPWASSASTLELRCDRPNRNFRADGPARESTAVIDLIAPYKGQFVLHIDLHETTDSDESEFRPALAARRQAVRAGPDSRWFYLVDDSENPQPAFQQAVIAAVEKVTHIAPADDKGEIIGSPVVAHGVIEYPLVSWACVPALPVQRTPPPPRSTRTARAHPQQCNDAQVAAVRGAGLRAALG